MSKARILLQKFSEGMTPRELIEEGRYGSRNTVYRWFKRWKKFKTAMDVFLDLFTEVQEMPTKSKKVMGDFIKEEIEK